MKNHSLWTLAIMVIGSSMALSAAVQAAPDLKRTFQPLYDRLDKANANKNSNIILSMHSPSYLTFDEKGEKHNLDHVREGMLELFAKYKIIHFKTVVQSATVAKGGAVIVAHTQGILVRDSSVPGQEVTITTDEGDRDYWIKSPDGWKMEQERTLFFHQTRNKVAVQ